MNLLLSEVYKVFGRKTAGQNLKVAGISIDTRSLKKGEIFFAIKGDVTDGHRFIKNALDKGAALIVCEKSPVKSKRCLIVKNSRNALLKLSGYYFRKFRDKGMKVVAITGSNGKTTTKEIAAALFSEKYRVLKNRKSYNNYAGLPLTLFELKKNTEVLVAELGMNRKGEIKRLAKTIDIDFAVITNIGRAHMGFFKNIAGIADAKAEIFCGLDPKGCASLNSDDRFYRKLAAAAGKFDVVSFGSDDNADLKIERIKDTGTGTEFRLDVMGNKIELKTKLKGIHNMRNIAAAVSAAVYFGVSFSSIKKALRTFEMPGMMRFEERKRNGLTIINDSYNANPDSFKASIESLKNMNKRNLVVITGDMLELGKNSPALHKEVGKELAKLKIKKLLIYGKYGEYVKKGFLNSKFRVSNSALKEEFVQVFTDKSALVAEYKTIVNKGDTVFLKGSRGNKLEEVIR